jgi:uncharacterized repeat protein (TIGR03803 family)
MKMQFSFTRSVLNMIIAAALLAGCGGSQPPIGAPGATRQASAIASARGTAHRLSASYQQLYRFHPPFNGERPFAGLLDVGGILYGTSYGGGSSGKGTVYRISTSGAHKVLYRFRGGSDGRNPLAGLIDVNGTLYGTTYGGGGTGCYSRAFGCGTVYSVSTAGAEKVLYAFKGGSDGFFPKAGLIDVKGTLYGTTEGGGGACATDDECGTVFSITTSGTEKVLHSFGGAAGNDGAFPEASLINVNGTLYGTTSASAGGKGTVFSISTSGKEKVLYFFGGGSDGENPYASLIDVNGTLYGTTLNGGGGKCGSFGCGTVFDITTSGQEAVLYTFQAGADGARPQAALIEVNGALYGTTTSGGAYCYHSCGTVYSLSTSGAEQVLHSFGASGDGAIPIAGLIEVNGTLYGTTFGSVRYVGGGTHGRSTVFALTASGSP